MLLLDEYQKRYEKFRNPKIKKKKLWMEIVNVINTFGYNVDADIVDRKIRNMKATFRKIKENNSKSKTGRGTISWEYYGKFKEIFSGDKTINLRENSLISSTLAATSSGALELEPSENLALFDRSSSTTPTSTSKGNTSIKERQVKLDKFRKRQMEGTGRRKAGGTEKNQDSVRRKHKY